MFHCIWYHNIGLDRGEHTHFNRFSFCFFSTFHCELVQLRQVQQPVASCKHSPTIITCYTLYMHSEGVHALLSCSIDHVSLIMSSLRGTKKDFMLLFSKTKWARKWEAETSIQNIISWFTGDDYYIYSLQIFCRTFETENVRAYAKCDYTKLKMTPY